MKRLHTTLLLSLVVMAASAAAAQMELEALFVGIPKDFVTIAYRDKGGMNASNVLVCLQKQGDALVSPPLKLVCTSGAAPMVRAVTQVRYPSNYEVLLPGTGVSNLPPMHAPAVVFLPINIDQREHGATLRVDDMKIDESGTLHGLVRADLSLPAPDGYDAICINTDGSRTNLTLTTPAYTCLSFSTSVALASNVPVLLGSQEMSKGMICFVVLTARPLP